MSNRCSRTPPESSSMTEVEVKMSGRLGKDGLKSSAIEVQVQDNVTGSSSKSVKAEENEEETERMSSKRKRIKESSTIKCDNTLVGSKVKVWWKYYERFYEGVIASYDHVKRKHKVCYDDGDVEDLYLRRERWEFVDDDSVKNGDAKVEPSCHDTSSDTQRKKKKEVNTNSESLKSSKLKDSATKSGGKSKDNGKPEPEIKVNHSTRSRNYVDDANIKPVILALEYQGDSGKASCGKSKDDDKPKSEIKVNNSKPCSNYADDAAIKPQKFVGESQNGKTLIKTSSSPNVKESLITMPKTASSSKGGEGNSLWPNEGTLHPQSIKSTLRRLSQMLDEGINAGVTIITSDGSLKAHDSILSTSSPIFRSMFQNDLREKVSTVEMKEMTSESCKALLSFLYGSLSQEAFLRHCLDLLGAASKYEIVDLKDACEQSLLEDIKSGNVLERLQQAWLYKLDKLKKGCFKYLLDSEKISNVREVMTEFFKQAERGLLVEMCEEVLAVLKRS